MLRITSGRHPGARVGRSCDEGLVSTRIVRFGFPLLLRCFSSVTRSKFRCFTACQARVKSLNSRPFLSTASWFTGVWAGFSLLFSGIGGCREGISPKRSGDFGDFFDRLSKLALS